MKQRADSVRIFLISIVALLLGATVFSSFSSATSANTSTARFAVIGDFGTARSKEKAVADLIHGWDVDFVATVGDNNYPDGLMPTMDENVGQHYQQYIKPYIGNYCSGSPDVNRFFPALGNHDWHSITCNATGTACTGAHFDYFDLPGNERYYDVLWGPVHLFIVNSNYEEPDGTKSDSRQAAWLQTQLAASTAAWKLVFMHHAPYSSSAKHGSTTRMQWPYKEWGASAVLAGHDHVYERLLVGDLLYFVDGLGGATPYSFMDTPLRESQARYSDDHGALLVEASNASITFQFFNTSGELIDTYSLKSEIPTTDAPTPTATPTPTGAINCYALNRSHVGPGNASSARPNGSIGCSPGKVYSQSPGPIKCASWMRHTGDRLGWDE